MLKLICVGHTTLDTFLTIEEAELHCDINNRDCVVCFKFGSKIPVKKLLEEVGGGAANVAIGTKKLEIDSYLYSLIGNDPKGKDIEKLLKERQANCSLLSVDNNPSDQSTIITFSHERTIFTYAHPRVYDFSIVKKENPNFIYLASIAPNITNFYEDLICYKSERSDLCIFYNPGSKELHNFREDILKLLPYVDHLFVNVEEACRIVNPALKREQIEIKDLCGLLLAKGPKNIAVTDGAGGVYYANESVFKHFNSVKVTVSEVTGAGDAFSSGYIAGLINSGNYETAVSWGILNSSSVIQKTGAQKGLLSLAEIKSLA